MQLLNELLGFLSYFMKIFTRNFFSEQNLLKIFMNFYQFFRF